MSSNNNSSSGNNHSNNSREVAHYVVTAHPPGAVLLTAKCNFVSANSMNVIVAKSRRLEIRQVVVRNAATTDTNASSSSPFPLVCTVPIHGRITAMVPFQLPLSPTSYLFVMTERQQYAVISYNQEQEQHFPIVTHASGSFQDQESYVLGREAECGPLVCVDVHSRCVAIHLFDGLLTIIPINTSYDGAKALQEQEKLAQQGPLRKSKRLYSTTTTTSSHATTKSFLLGEPYHGRIEERTVLDLDFLYTNGNSSPTISLLHQDSTCQQHVTTHVVDLKKKKLLLYGSVHTKNLHLLKKSRVDGGSSKLIAVPTPPPTTTATMGKPKRTGEEDDDESLSETTTTSTSHNNHQGGLLVLGQRQVTYLSLGTSKVIPISQALLLSYSRLPGMEPQYLLSDEFGNLMLLSIHFSNSGVIMGLEMDVLGTTNISSALEYLCNGLVYVGSQFGDSQLIQIHNDDNNTTEPDPSGSSMEPKSRLSVVEEFTHLGPIVDFDLVPTSNSSSDRDQQQSQVVTASGTSFSGTLRLIRNGIGMNEYAAVEIPGIQAMFNIKQHYHKNEDGYLVQSFVGETRVLGVVKSEDAMQEDDDDNNEENGTLEEVFLEGLDSQLSSLFVGNVQVGDTIVQVTESEIRLMDTHTLQCIDTWSPVEIGSRRITVASGNGSGQLVLALEGGTLLSFVVSQQDDGCKIVLQQSKEMEREISCINLNPFVEEEENAMDTDAATKSRLVAVGLWDDFTVRLLALEELEQVLEINLSTEEQDEDEQEEQPQAPHNTNTNRNNRNNMMARSLCLVTLDSSSSSGSSPTTTAGGVNMLFVGLGDGTLVSFAVVSESSSVTVRSKKQVSLGTQRINLVPLYTQGGGTCVLATGDRPTVIYLAGGGGGSGGVNFSNPKLCYSNVNLSTSSDDANDDDDEENVVSRPPAQQSIAIHVATPLTSSILFDTPLSSGRGTGGGPSQHYSLCVADDVNLRLGVIDDIQKLHITTCRLGMAPRRIVHCPEGRLFAVGCIESGVREGGALDTDAKFGNCIRFLDDTTFDDLQRIDLEPHEMILSMARVNLSTVAESSLNNDESCSDPVSGRANAARSATTAKPYLLVGTAYTLPDEDEPTNGRILVYKCSSDDGVDGGKGAVRQFTELSVHGAVYSMCQFYQHMALVSVNSKTQICRLVEDGTGIPKLTIVGIGHHGHILSLYVKSRAHLTTTATDLPSVGTDVASASAAIPVLHETPTKSKEQSEENEEQGEQLAIVGDLMRSISLVQYYSKHETLEEIARDFNANWTTAVEMLTDDIYLGAENWNNLFVLRRNAKAQSDEVRCRLDTIGEFHLGEMVNKFMGGSLIMPQSNAPSSSDSSIRGMNLRTSTPKSPTKGDGKKKAVSARTRRPVVTIGSQTLFGTVDGSLGSILGLDMKTAVFFSALEGAMEQVIPAVGDFGHFDFRTFQAEKRVGPSHGFVDGDLVESFLDLDRATMEAVVREMNNEDRWEVEEHAAASGDTQGGAAGQARGGSMSDDDEDEDMATNGGSALTVEDVLAMVEEMTMLH